MWKSCTQREQTRGRRYKREEEDRGRWEKEQRRESTKTKSNHNDASFIVQTFNETKRKEEGRRIEGETKKE
ncbi:hypothetical protein ANTRET_LOCUS4111 [Anthophora retusa]